MCRWKTVCQAAGRHELMRLTPSAPRRSRTLSARRWAALTVVASTSGSAVHRSSMCSLGMTSACPQVAGLMSMKASVCSSSSTLMAGTSPATILQKMQSSAMRPEATDRRRSRRHLPRTGERLLPRGDFAGEPRRLELGEDGLQPRPGIAAERAGDLVAAHERRGCLRLVGEGLAEELARELQVLGDRLVGLAPPG